MPEKLPKSGSNNMDQNGDSHHQSEQQFLPYNEKVLNTVNASIASAMAGRTIRTQAAVSSSFPRGIFASGKQNDVTKALDTVRGTLQKFINQDLHASLQKYVKEYFEPAIDNLKSNCGADSVTDAHVSALLCRILDEAKKMYEPAPPVNPAPVGSTTAFDVDQVHEPFTRYGGQRRGSSDSYSSATSSVKRIKVEKEKRKLGPSRKTTEKVSAPGEDFNSRDSKAIHSISENTNFILGASANKILGYAAARGRIYVKYPNLFKYVGDQEDKQWLFESRIMSAAGGKAFLVLAEDIREILRLNETTRDLVSETKNFAVPPFMLEKVRAAAGRFINTDTRSRSGSSVSNLSQDSRALTERDEDETDLEPTVDTPPPEPSPPSHFIENADNPFANNSSPSDGFYDNLIDSADAFGW